MGNGEFNHPIILGGLPHTYEDCCFDICALKVDDVTRVDKLSGICSINRDTS